MTGFLDWLGRVVMLVLAGLITLSIIGAIAAIPSGSIEPPVRVDPSRWPAPRPEPQPRPIPPQPQPEPEAPVPEAAPAPGPAPIQVVPAPPKPLQPADWLETIAYALLALAGIFALATILLARAIHHWRRTADALEALAQREGG
jgi:hypothetical protein